MALEPSALITEKGEKILLAIPCPHCKGSVHGCFKCHECGMVATDNLKLIRNLLNNTKLI